MYIDSSVVARETPAPVDSGELAEGLMLVRASTLKMIRLQLAVERHDRLATLAAVDDLVALDSQLQDYLDAIPTTRNQGLRRALDADRFALNQEKLALAAEVLCRPSSSIEQTDVIEETGWLEVGNASLARVAQEQRRSRWWLVIAAVLFSCLAATAYFVGVPDAAPWFAEAARALK
jgi:hypothetical protein